MSHNIIPSFLKSLTVFIFFGMLISSCSKSPGIGGKATISGHVNVYYIDKNSFDTIDFAGYPDTRVYINYGENSVQDDDSRTSPDGRYKFEYLNPGTYTVYTYSESLLTSSELEVVSATLTIDKKQNDVIVPSLTVIKYVK